MKHTCSECNTNLKRPLDQNANYIRSLRHGGPQTRERHIGYRHTDKTWAKVEKVAKRLPNRDAQALAAEMAHPSAKKSIEVDGDQLTVEDDGVDTTTTPNDEIEFSIPTEKFDHVPLGSPNEIQKRDDIALVESLPETRKVQETAVICPDCTKDDDEIIWGVDKE